MFYFLNPITILIAAAVLPAVFLMNKVYKSDHLEKESPILLRKLMGGGILSAILALIAERILITILNKFADPYSAAYRLILYFLIVPISEEGFKFLFLRKISWKEKEFNCLYDGVVYAVFVSLGFALIENIIYVFTYGLQTALIRAITAIPGHACFGVFMGIFYGAAKKYDYEENKGESGVFMFLALFIPTMIHGFYDYIAVSGQESSGIYFLVFIAILFIATYILIGKIAKSDRPIIQTDTPEQPIDQGPISPENNNDPAEIKKDITSIIDSDAR